MKRTENLQNVFYHRKYKEIYKIIFTADLDSVSDYLYWHLENPSYVEKNKPLWVVCESKLIGKRIWITEDFGEKEITTADLDLNINSIKYSESYKRRTFTAHDEMVSYLNELLKPCLEKNVPKELREGIYEIAPIKEAEYLHFNINAGTIVFGYNPQNKENRYLATLPSSSIYTIEAFDKFIEQNDKYRKNLFQKRKVNLK